MFLSKLISVMQALDQDDVSRLDVYVHSPYFNVPAAAISLFEYLAPFHPRFPEKKLSSEEIGKTSKNISSFSKQARAGTVLLQAIEDFLALEDWVANDRDREYHLFRKVKQLGLSRYFETEYNKSLTSLEQDKEQDIDVFYYKHLYSELNYSGFDALLKRTQQNDLTPMLRSLDEFYAVKQLRYLCEAVSRKQVLGTTYDESYIAFILKILEPFINHQYPYVYLFANVYRMQVEKDFAKGEEHYQLIRKFVETFNETALSEAYKEVINYAVNWCLSWFNRGVLEMGNEYLWWIRFKIRQGAFLEKEKLMPITFRNVVSLSTLCEENSEWMKRFIDTYSNLLYGDSNETSKAFAYGLYYYKIGEYQQAIRSFLEAQAKDEVIFNAIIRRWQYMSTYELNPSDTDLLLNQLSAFEKYISRNPKAFHQFKEVFQKFIAFAKKSLQLKANHEKLYLKKVVEEEVFFPGKPWLLSKLS